MPSFCPKGQFVWTVNCLLDEKLAETARVWGQRTTTLVSFIWTELCWWKSYLSSKRFFTKQTNRDENNLNAKIFHQNRNKNVFPFYNSCLFWRKQLNLTNPAQVFEHRIFFFFQVFINSNRASQHDRQKTNSSSKKIAWAPKNKSWFFPS